MGLRNAAPVCCFPTGSVGMVASPLISKQKLLTQPHRLWFPNNLCLYSCLVSLPQTMIVHIAVLPPVSKQKSGEYKQFLLKIFGRQAYTNNLCLEFSCDSHMQTIIVCVFQAAGICKQSLIGICRLLLYTSNTCRGKQDLRQKPVSDNSHCRLSATIYGFS